MSERETPSLAADMLHGIAWAYRFGADGRGVPFHPAPDFRLDGAGEGFVWVHLNLADSRSHEWLTHHVTLPDDARDMMLDPSEHQQFHHIANLLWGIVADLVREFDRNSQTMAHMRFILGERFIVSGRKHPLQGVEAARQAVDAGQTLAAPAELFETIIEQVVDCIANLVQVNADGLNEVEDRILDEKFHAENRELGPIRRSSARLHRQLTGMRTIFLRFEMQAQTNFSGEVRAASTRLVQRIEALHQEVYSTQERARLLQDETASRLSNQTNRNLALLTMVTTLFLPPTLITGMFGMNVKGLLFADNDNGYVFAMLICVCSVALVYLFMRRIGIGR